MCLLNQPNTLQNISYVIESAYFGLQRFIIDDFIVGNLASGFLQWDYIFPTHEQVDKLLAEVTQRFHFFVFGLAFALLAH